MKKLYTRLLALVMALAMALSCTAVASAAEVSEEINEDMQYVIVTFEDGSMSLEAVDKLPSSTKSYSRDFVSFNGALTNGKGENGTFMFPKDSRGSVVIAYGATGAGSLKVNVSSSNGNSHTGNSSNGEIKKDSWVNMYGGETITWSFNAQNGDLTKYAFLISGYIA